VIDLDGLAFAGGSHFMSNKGCTLPPGSYRWVWPLVCVCGGGVRWGGVFWVWVSVGVGMLGDGSVGVGVSPSLPLDTYRHAHRVPAAVSAVLRSLPGSLTNRTTKKGYEEVHVPALKPKPYEDGGGRQAQGGLLLLWCSRDAGCTLHPHTHRARTPSHQNRTPTQINPTGEKLVAISDLPDWARPAFAGSVGGARGVVWHATIIGRQPAWGFSCRML
jgi:hypothetical protein